jgi:chemotaxis family two-component system response regulator Rcp1
MNRPINILLVEDNPGDVRLTQEALKDCALCCNLHVAIDGIEALDYLFHRGTYENSVRPDLILLDLNLPRKDGRTVLKEIKADPQLKRIPVIVLTTSGDERDILQAYNLYANSYIRKPLGLDKFNSIMSSIKSFWVDNAQLPCS